MTRPRSRGLRALAERLRAMSLTPSGTEGYAKAEVMLGGVDTAQLGIAAGVHGMTDLRNTPPMPSPEDLHVLAGEYVLGTLPAAERQAVQQRLQGEQTLQHAVAERWQRLRHGLASPCPRRLLRSDGNDCGSAQIFVVIGSTRASDALSSRVMASAAASGSRPTMHFLTSS